MNNIHFSSNPTNSNKILVILNAGKRKVTKPKNEWFNYYIFSPLDSISQSPSHFFSLSAIEPLSRTIWKSLDNNENKRLCLERMNEAQADECNRMIEYTRKLLIREFNYDSEFTAILKSRSGYLIYRSCSNQFSCETRWKININFSKRKAIVKFNKKCSHMFSNERKSKLYFILATFLIKLNVCIILINRNN